MGEKKIASGLLHRLACLAQASISPLPNMIFKAATFVLVNWIRYARQNNTGFAISRIHWGTKLHVMMVFIPICVRNINPVVQSIQWYRCYSEGCSCGHKLCNEDHLGHLVVWCATQEVWLSRMPGHEVRKLKKSQVVKTTEFLKKKIPQASGHVRHRQTADVHAMHHSAKQNN
jgi:hypothetical protein